MTLSQLPFDRCTSVLGGLNVPLGGPMSIAASTPRLGILTWTRLMVGSITVAVPPLELVAVSAEMLELLI